MLTRRLARLLSLLAVAAVLALASPECRAQEGVMNAQDLQRLLTDSRGRVAVVNFWASWCRPSLREIQSLEKLRLTTPRDKVFLVGVSLDFDREMYERFKSKQQFGYPVHLGAPDLMDQLGITSVPRTVIYTPGGQQACNHDGPMEYSELHALVRSLLDQQNKGTSP